MAGATQDAEERRAAAGEAPAHRPNLSEVLQLHLAGAARSRAPRSPAARTCPAPPSPRSSRSCSSSAWSPRRGPASRAAAGGRSCSSSRTTRASSSAWTWAPPTWRSRSPTCAGACWPGSTAATRCATIPRAPARWSSSCADALPAPGRGSRPPRWSASASPCPARSIPRHPDRLSEVVLPDVEGQQRARAAAQALRRAGAGRQRRQPGRAGRALVGRGPRRRRLRLHQAGHRRRLGPRHRAARSTAAPPASPARSATWPSIPHGAPCVCGLRGCLATLVGAPALVARARDAARASIPDSALAGRRARRSPSIEDAALAGDPLALQVVREAAEHLGIARGRPAQPHEPRAW